MFRYSRLVNLGTTGANAGAVRGGVTCLRTSSIFMSLTGPLRTAALGEGGHAFADVVGLHQFLDFLALHGRGIRGTHDPLHGGPRPGRGGPPPARPPPAGGG